MKILLKNLILFVLLLPAIQLCGQTVAQYGDFTAGNSTTTTSNFKIRTYSTSSPSAGPIRATILNSNGYFGIGVTSPASLLHVAGATQIDGGIKFGTATGTGNLVVNNSSNDFKLFLNADQRFIIRSMNGFAMLGSGTPLNALHIKTSGNNAVIQLEKPSDTYESGISFYRTTTNLFYLFNDDGDNGLKIKAVGLVGEDDVTPRMNFPYSSKNIFMAQSGGFVGIGTNAPATKLDVQGSVSIRSGDHLSWGGAVGSLIPSISGQSTSGLTFYSAGSSSAPMRLDASGNLSIGTLDAKNYRLAVAGRGVMEDIVIALQANWPDYVFDSTYQLMPLKDLGNYVTTNKHLPEVPTKQEVEKDGYSVNQLNEVLLKKVEELTLYIIEQQKEIEALKCEVANKRDKKKRSSRKHTAHLIIMQ